ncbi:HAMP domain-containing histidine kinase [Pseudonocardia bannensis]|uniref:Sensor histidine kinase MtrB n=2 Tax=Pseudonocardia bannensis TaxID=630973 RepID=A0A848DLE8_9PSEU|nr:HAMP domain-containing histidine kinase [Pseudonocardia bannensis]
MARSAPGVRLRRGVAHTGQLVHEVRSAFAAAWRRSLQLRVVVSTLALSTAVVVVLGLVLQTQIAERLVQGKFDAALVQADSGRAVLERDLSGVDPDREGAQGTLNNALDRLTNTSLAAQPGSPTAGEFRAVLTTGSGSGTEISAGTVEDVPADLMHAVAQGGLATKYSAVADMPTLMIGQPIRTAGRDLQFYLLFPLDAEQRTLGLVQSTLIVGGLVLILLLAGITSLVTRQVVRPVRQAAEVAERFADGHLDERMPVHGDDEVARLAESYNEMAGSIQSQIRQLEEFGALQRRFTSDVSHELRTPLTTVRMAADVLYASRDELLPALRRSSELLVNELDRFEALLGDLLEISRLDAGVAELGAERLDMHGVVSRAVEAVRGLAEESGTPLELDLPVEVFAEVDPRRVERIVRNLVANAIDHGEGRPVRVTLGSDEHTVAVLVRDEGVGLRPGEAGLVFNRFWRAEESRARRSGGSGLGLSISLEDARLHGGWLQAWGEPGVGSAFRLTLPRTVGDVVTSSPLPLGPETGTHEVPDPGEPSSVLTPPLGIPRLADAEAGSTPGGSPAAGDEPAVRRAEPAIMEARPVSQGGER